MTASQIILWIEAERERLLADVALLSSGRRRVMETRRRQVLDVTGERLKDAKTRLAELDRLLGQAAPEG